MSSYHRKPDDTAWANVRVYRKHYNLLREIATKKNLTLNDTFAKAIENYRDMESVNVPV